MLNPETVNYQNQYDYARYPPLIDLGSAVENIIGNVKNWWEDLKANSQQVSLDNYQKYPSTGLGAQPLQISTSIEPQPAQLEYENQNSIIHEELAEKTKELTEQKEEIQCLQIEDEKNKKRISRLEKQIKELKKERRLLGWINRAINDSKKEKII